MTYSFIRHVRVFFCDSCMSITGENSDLSPLYECGNCGHRWVGGKSQCEKCFAIGFKALDQSCPNGCLAYAQIHDGGLTDEGELFVFVPPEAQVGAEPSGELSFTPEVMAKMSMDLPDDMDEEEDGDSPSD